MVAIGADMLLRDLYLPADNVLDLPAAKAVTSELCRQATVAELRVLLEHHWISHPALDDYDPPHALVAEHTTALQATAEQSLHKLLEEFAASLHARDVARFRFDRADTDTGIDAYLTGGCINGDSPTDSYDAWAIVYDTHAFPADWCDRIGAAAGLLHPAGTGQPTTSVTFHAWA